MSTPTGDWGTVEELYRSCRDDLYAYLVALLRDPATAEDVCALAFERAYRRSASFDGRRGPARPWLFGIARNAALDELRRRRRVASLAAEPAQVDAAETAGDEDGLLARTVLRAALRELDARDRELIALKFHAGLSNAEMARVLGVSESNVGTRLHRVVTKLRGAVNAPA